ncbi:MAG: hypothetical protein ACM31N_06285 [Deltaproteobacteria bacterium]
MIRKIAMAALVLLFSAGLFPLSCFAVEDDKSIRVGRVGDAVEAYVNITSSEGRMSAAPQFIIRENREIGLRGAGIGDEKERKSLTKLLPEGGISYSNGMNLINKAREAIKQRKQEKANAAKTSGPAERFSSGQANPAADNDGEIDFSGHVKAAVDLCKSCDFRSISEGSIRQ